MRLIKIIDSITTDINYVNFENINNIVVFGHADNKDGQKIKDYNIELHAGNDFIAIARGIRYPDEIIKNFITIINTVKNDIIEYEVIREENRLQI